MEQQVARRAWRGGPRAVQLDERVRRGRSRALEQPVPGLRADRGDHRQVFGGIAESDGAHQPGNAGQRVVHRRLPALVDGDYQEDGGWWEWREHRLRIGHVFDPNVSDEPVMKRWGPWLPWRKACANSSTRPRRRFMSAPPWRPGCVRPATPSSPRRITGHPLASSLSCGPAHWWPGTTTTMPAVDRSGSSAATPTALTCGSSNIPTVRSSVGRWSRWSPMAVPG